MDIFWKYALWYLAWFVFNAWLNFKVQKSSLLFLNFFMTLERTGKAKNARRTCFLGHIIILIKFEGKWLKNLMKANLKHAPNIFSRKRAEQFQRRSSSLTWLKPQGLKIITCSLQANGWTYFITIALKYRRDKCKILFCAGISMSDCSECWNIHVCLIDFKAFYSPVPLC